MDFGLHMRCAAARHHHPRGFHNPIDLFIAVVMAPEIEQLPDRSGFLKFPSQPAWLRVPSRTSTFPK
jgi:hypothetical protein